MWELYQAQALVLALTFTRIAGLVLTMPVFSSRAVPVRFRLLLAVLLVLLLAPLHWGPQVDWPRGTAELVVIFFREAVVGTTLGLGIAVLLTGMQLAGQLLGQLSGLSLAEVVDPTWNVPLPACARLLDLLAVTVFLLLGGHRQLLSALLQTFQWMPPGRACPASSAMTALEQVLAQSFALGLRAAAPMLAALLVATLVLGFVSRLAAPLNALSLGLGINFTLLLATLSVSLGAMAWLLQDRFEATLELLLETLRGSA